MKVVCAVCIFALLSTHQVPFDKSLYYQKNQGKWVYFEWFQLFLKLYKILLSNKLYILSRLQDKLESSTEDLK